MNKKQAGIIVTLLALIVCAGILAAKVNGPLEVTSNGFNENGGILTWNNDKGKTNTSTDFFTTTRDKRDSLDQQTLANLKSIMDDKNVPEANKNEATQKYTEFAAAQKYEQTIEQVLKGKGFDDVICYLENNNSKARIVVKAKNLDDITANQRKVIQDVVYSQAKIKNVEVECQQ